MENLTPAGIWSVIAWVAAAIILLANAGEKIVKATKAVRAPEQQQNAEIEEIKNRLDKVERKLDNDKVQIADAKECNHVLTKGMLALLEHGINGNNIDQMRDARNGVEAYLINH